MSETLEDKVREMMDVEGVKTDGEAIESEDIQVGGVKVVEVKDKNGRVWAVPADDDNIDPRELALRNILEIPRPEEDFYYQYVGSDRLGEFLSRDFALVEPEEVGLPKAFDPSAGANAALGVRPSAHHQVGNLHLVKIPKLLEKRYRRIQKARANEAIAGALQPRRGGEPSGPPLRLDGTVVQTVNAERTVNSGEPFVAKNPGFKEYPSEDKK